MPNDPQEPVLPELSIATSSNPLEMLRSKPLEAHPFLPQSARDYAYDFTRVLPGAVEGALGSLHGVANFVLGGGSPDFRRSEASFQPRTGAGGLLSGVGEAAIIAASTFGLGIGGAMASGARMLGAGTRVAWLSGTMAHGAAIDFIMGREGEALSHWLSSLDSETAQAVGSLLDSDASDSEIERRLKALAGGGVLGLGFSGIGSGVRYLRARSRVAKAVSAFEKNAGVQPTGSLAERARRARTEQSKLFEELRRAEDVEAAALAYEARLDDVRQSLKEGEVFGPPQRGFTTSGGVFGPPSSRLERAGEIVRTLRADDARRAQEASRKANLVLPSRSSAEVGFTTPEGIRGPEPEPPKQGELLRIERREAQAARGRDLRRAMGLPEEPPTGERLLPAPPRDLDVEVTNRVRSGATGPEAFEASVRAAIGEDPRVLGIGRGAEDITRAAGRIGADPKIVSGFIDSIGRHLFDDLTVVTVDAEGGAFTRSRTQLGQDLLFFGMRSADGNLTALHELSHAVEEVLLRHPDDLKIIEDAFAAEKAAAPAARQGAHEFRSWPEWWSTRLAEFAVKKIKGEQAQPPPISGLSRQAFDAAEEIIGLVAKKLGKRKAKDVFQDFLKGRFRSRATRRATAGKSILQFSEEAAAKPDTFEDLARRIYGERGAQELSEGLQEFSARPGLKPDVVPHAMGSEEKVLQFLEDHDLTTKYLGNTASANYALRYAQRLMDNIPGGRARAETRAQFAASVDAELNRLAKATATDPTVLRKELGLDAPQAEIDMAKARKALQVRTRLMVAASKQVVRLASRVVAEGTDQVRALFIDRFSFLTNLKRTVRSARTEWGRMGVDFRETDVPMSEEALDILRERVRGGAPEESIATAPPRRARAPVEAKPKAPGRRPTDLSPNDEILLSEATDGLNPTEDLLTDPKAMSESIQRAGGRKNVDRIARDTLARAEGKPGEAAIDLVPDLVEMSEYLKHVPTMPAMWANLMTRQLISAPWTWGKVLFSEAAFTGVVMSRPGFGASVLRAYNSLISRNPVEAARMRDTMRTAHRMMGGFFSRGNLHEMANAYYRSYREGTGRLVAESSVEANLGRGKYEASARNLEGWRQRRELLAPEWMKPMLAKDGLAWSIFSKPLAKYSDALSYVSTRPLTAPDEAMKVGLTRQMGRALLEQRVMEMMPTRPDLWEQTVEAKMKVLFDDGVLLSVDRAKSQGRQIAMEELGFKDDGAEGTRAIKRHETKMLEEMERQHPELFDLSETLLDRANEVAGTLPYADTRFGKTLRSLDQFITSAGWPKFIVPFMRTPYSLIRSSFQHFDYAGVFEAISLSHLPRESALREATHQFSKDFYSGDAFRRADAVGRIAYGTTIFALTGIYAAGENEKGQPLLTGSLSKSPQMRAIQERDGMQEYSVWIPGVGYASYAWMEPLSTLIGSIADITTAARVNPQTREPIELGSAAIIALSKNFESKSFLDGTYRFFHALQSGDVNQMTRVLMRAGVGATPVLGLNTLKAVSTVGERVFTGGSPIREVRSMADAYMERIPYFRQSAVAVARNIYGEPIDNRTYLDAGLFLPFVFNTVKDDLVSDELRNLGHPFGPPRPVRNGLNLDLLDVVNDSGMSAWDRWQELIGQVKGDRGMRIHDALRATIKSPDYKLLPVEGVVGEPDRIGEIGKVLERYRAVAYEKMLREYPEVSRLEGVKHTRAVTRRQTTPRSPFTMQPK